MAEQWSAQEAGADLLAGMARVIRDEMRASRDIDPEALARAVLTSPALRDSCMATVDALMEERLPQIAQRVAEEAAPLVAAAVEPFREALKRHMIPLGDSHGTQLCAGCLEPKPCPDEGLATPAEK